MVFINEFICANMALLMVFKETWIKTETGISCGHCMKLRPKLIVELALVSMDFHNCYWYWYQWISRSDTIIGIVNYL